MTSEEMEVLKKKHGKITTVEIPLDADDETKILTFHLKSPEKITRKMVVTMVRNGQPEGAIVAGYKQLWVAGDDVDELLKNDYAMASADEALVTLLEVKKAIIKKN